jgi:hypothetical protein
LPSGSVLVWSKAYLGFGTDKMTSVCMGDNPRPWQNYNHDHIGSVSLNQMYLIAVDSKSVKHDIYVAGSSTTDCLWSVEQPH